MREIEKIAPDDADHDVVENGLWTFASNFGISRDMAVRLGHDVLINQNTRK
ncbi:hypothetical protein FWF74_03340 [Candidatus Saccharibacteria bacterium]|nr:hypothetical protein [Candidatus Saccharibacteria bacterium]MCL1962883.1 hypothetical protein [Candidatus Saccharibacteria bacterium]